MPEYSNLCERHRIRAHCALSSRRDDLQLENNDRIQKSRVHFARRFWLQRVGRVDKMQRRSDIDKNTGSEMSYQGLGGRTFIVTGAAGGIGSAIVERLVKEGCRLIAFDSHADNLSRLTGQFSPQQVCPLIGDVSTEESWDSCLELAVRQFGSINGLVNNAAVGGTDFKISEMPVGNSTGYLESTSGARFWASAPHFDNSLDKESEARSSTSPRSAP